MNWILSCLSCLVLGLIWGMAQTMWVIKRGINQADISRDEKDYIRDILGIPPSE